jgi:hypothetical protein
MEPEEAILRMRRAVAIGGYMDAEETEDCTRAALTLVDRYRDALGRIAGGACACYDIEGTCDFCVANAALAATEDER